MPEQSTFMERKMNFNEKIVNVLTNEETLRPYSAEEIVQLEKSIEAIKEKQINLENEAKAKADARVAILKKLGLTEEEAAVLLS